MKAIAFSFVLLAIAVADGSGLAANWVDPADASRWLTTLSRFRTVLAPPPASADVPLFDIGS